MTRQAIGRIIRPLKPLLSKLVWRDGTVRTILWGPCRGLRYRIFPHMGRSPIYGGWEQEAQDLIVKHVGKGSVVYDVGANYGIHTLLFARLAGADGHIYAFEPAPEIHHALQENVLLNKFGNVTCVQLAVDDQSGDANFLSGHHVGAGALQSAMGSSGRQSIVRTVTLDDFVFKSPNRPPDFIKIDIEGAESKALAGGIKTLEALKPILLVDLHNPEQDRAVGKILLQLGYRAYHTDNHLPVKDLSKGWPHTEGLWGQFIAFPA